MILGLQEEHLSIPQEVEDLSRDFATQMLKTEPNFPVAMLTRKRSLTPPSSISSFHLFSHFLSSSNNHIGNDIKMVSCASCIQLTAVGHAAYDPG
jgi:hypothetical protein